MNLLAFSGFIPEQICDTKRFTGYPGRMRISHYCGYAADFLSQVLEDGTVDGAVFPRSCDSSRVMGSYLEGCGKFVYQLHVPARRDAAAAEYLAGNLRAYRDALEAHYSVTIPEQEIRDRTELINERNRALAGRYESIERLSYGAWLDGLHRMLQTPLCKQEVPEGGQLAAVSCQGGRIFVVGSFLGDTEAAYTLEAAGLKVVGDRLTESTRLFRAPPVRTEGDIFLNLAEGLLFSRRSPTQDDFSGILAEDLEEIRKREAQGVVFVTQKYCEPYDYLYYVYKKRLEAEGIPLLRIVLSDGADWRRIEIAAEAFAQML